MKKSLTIKFTRKEVEALGLVKCKCGHPKNNHYDFDYKGCAHCECMGYDEKVRYGKLVKGKK